MESLPYWYIYIHTILVYLKNYQLNEEQNKFYASFKYNNKCQDNKYTTFWFLQEYIINIFIRVHLNFGWIYKVETNKVPVYLHMCFKWQHPDTNTDELNK